MAKLQVKQPKTFIRHHYMFRTHPDINTARMTFNHQLSIEWQVCTPPHFNLQYTQHGLLSGPKLFAQDKLR
jgi:hypothetical protein